VLCELRGGDILSPRRLAERVTPPVPLANVAHHVRELAARGMVEGAGTRPVRGALEHFYTLSPRGQALMEFVDRMADSNGAP
jgi:predicted RNA-binding Zn ribbon-like protein